MDPIYIEKLKQFDTGEVNHLYEEELRLIDLIKRGNIDKLTQELDKGELSFPFLTKDELKNYSYMLVSATAVICRASIDAGSEPTKCILLSDYFLREIGDMKSEKEGKALIRRIVLTYAKMNKDTLMCSQKNALVIRAKKYISEHLFERISLADVANNMNISKEHLSRCFSQEMRSTVNQYILACKIDVAKSLLSTTNREIREISDLLCFISSSYFCKLFSRLVGITPKRYRLSAAEQPN